MTLATLTRAAAIAAADTHERTRAMDMIGRRVEIPAHFDAWMMGDRYGVIVAQTRLNYVIRLDRSGRNIRVRVVTLETFGQYV